MTSFPERAPTLKGLQLYLSRQAATPGRYLLEQLCFAVAGWVPTPIGIGLRAALYRLILRMDGIVAIENGVRLRFAGHIHLCLLYTSPSPRDRTRSRMPSSA